MAIELAQRLEGEGRHVGAHLRRDDDVDRVAHGSDQDFRLEVVAGVDRDHLADQVHAVLGDVVEPADEGRDVGGAGLRRQQRLGRREAQGHVAPDPLLRQPPHSGQPRRSERHLDDHVVGEAGEPPALVQHAVEVRGQHLAADGARHQFRDLLDRRQVRLALPGDQARVRGDAVDHAPFQAGLDLSCVRGVEKELHRGAPR